MVEARLSRFIEQYKECYNFKITSPRNMKSKLLIGTNNPPTSENKIVQIIIR